MRLTAKVTNMDTWVIETITRQGESKLQKNTQVPCNSDLGPEIVGLLRKNQVEQPISERSELSKNRLLPEVINFFRGLQVHDTTSNSQTKDKAVG